MAIRPTLHAAEPKKKNLASHYNDNFDMMMDFIDDSIDESKDYVDAFMPAQTGNSGKFLTTDGTSTSWVNVGGNFPYSKYIDGLIITKVSDDTISVSKGSCYDTTGLIILSLNTDTQAQFEDLGPRTYYVYITGDGTTCSIIKSTSATTPSPSELPTGHIYYRLIGSFTTDADSKIKTVSSLSADATGASEEFIDSENESGYRVYSDGFCEQWGYCENANGGAYSGGTEVDLLIEFKDTTYNIQATGVPEGNPKWEQSVLMQVGVKTKSNFRLLASTPHANWYAIGYIR